MKTNILYSVTYLLESFFIAIIIILVSAIATAKAGNTPSIVPDSIQNGLFTPTAADRFFEAGREDFEEAIDFLTDSESYLNGDLLQIDPELQKQMQQMKTFPNLERDNFYIKERAS